MLVPIRSLRKSHTKTKQNKTSKNPGRRVRRKQTDSGIEETVVLARLLFQSTIERQTGAYQRSRVYG